MNAQVPVIGKDLCDMGTPPPKPSTTSSSHETGGPSSSGGADGGNPGRSPAAFSIANVMLPRLYYPTWQGNLLEQRCTVRRFGSWASAAPTQAACA